MSEEAKEKSTGKLAHRKKKGKKSPIPSTSAATSTSTSSSAPGTSANPAAAADGDTIFSNTEPVDPLDESFQLGKSSRSSD
ncbi:hypothetical protein J4Q44_G00006160 [Coregonus suidteri]|uniref:Uncharacterized protein n=1 Tax=Coregonus suidteri TaxID=861788 RepID=A0AAN8R910_9TELE